MWLDVDGSEEAEAALLLLYRMPALRTRPANRSILGPSTVAKSKPCLGALLI